MASSPKLFRASFCAVSSASKKSSAWLTILMPLPPPPALAFTKTGNPTSLAISKALFLSVIASFIPGTRGTPNFSTACLLAILLPITSMLSGDGPMSVMPLSLNFRAKSAFSLKKPYPGCMASAPTDLAMAIILSAFR